MTEYYCQNRADLGESVAMHRHSLYAAKVEHGDDRIKAVTTERGRMLGATVVVEAESAEVATIESQYIFTGYLGSIGLGHLEVMTQSCRSKEELSAELDLLKQGIDPIKHTATIYEL